MESQLTSSSHRGFILVMVLIITAVGLLFGAGALLLFRFQCQQRIDRQHELEKLYAVRSALNWIRSYPSNKEFPTSGMQLKYFAGSSRQLNLFVKPVERIFPNLNFTTNRDNVVVKHLIMERGTPDPEGDSRLFAISPNQYNPKLDYEYGMMRMSTNEVLSGELQAVIPDLGMVDKVDESFIANFEKENKFSDPVYGLDFPYSNTNNVKWWVNIGMPGTGSWLQEEYGRRYYFYPKDLFGAGNTGNSSDVLYCCIIRDKYHPEKKDYPGCQHGWPLSNGERALVLKLEKNRDPATQENVQAYLDLYEYEYGAVPVWIGRHSTRNMFRMGIQIAGKKVSLFWIDGSVKNNPADIKLGDIEMSDETYLYFRDGSVIDADGRIRSSPDLRVVFEILAVSTVRSEENVNFSVDDKINSEDFITEFWVAPAYQYDVFVKCPNVRYTSENGELATVAQLIPKTANNIGYPVITYDTHGTEHKGFRQDEREAERKKVR